MHALGSEQHLAQHCMSAEGLPDIFAHSLNTCADQWCVETIYAQGCTQVHMTVVQRTHAQEYTQAIR